MKKYKIVLSTDYQDEEFEGRLLCLTNDKGLHYIKSNRTNAKAVFTSESITIGDLNEFDLTNNAIVAGKRMVIAFTNKNGKYYRGLLITDKIVTISAYIPNAELIANLENDNGFIMLKTL